MHLSLCQHHVWQFFIKHQQVQAWDGDSGGSVTPSCSPCATLSTCSRGTWALGRVRSAPHLLGTWSYFPQVTCSPPEFQDSSLHKGKKPQLPPRASNQALPRERRCLLSALLHLTGALVWVQLFHVLTETHSCWTRGWFSFLCWSWTLY